MKLKIEHILIIGLFIYIVLMQTCNSTPTIQPTKTITRVDSVTVTDTFINYVHVPSKIIYSTDTIYLKGQNNTYVYNGKDSLLDYSIAVTSPCYPDSVKLDYDVKQFTIRDSIYLKDSVHTIQPIKSYVSFGATLLGGEKSFGVVPQLFYNHKSGNNFGVGIDLLTQNLHITYVKRIRLKK